MCHNFSITTNKWYTHKCINFIMLLGAQAFVHVKRLVLSHCALGLIDEWWSWVLVDTSTLPPLVCWIFRFASLLFFLFFVLVFDLGSWRSFWIFDLDCWLFYWVVGGNILNGWWCFGGWLLFPTWSFGWWVMVVCAIVLAFGGLRTMQNFPFYRETNIEKWFQLYFQVGNQTWYNENILLKIF